MAKQLKLRSQQPAKKPKPTKFRPQVRSRHPTHAVLREELPLFGFKSVIRLGSTTELDDSLSSGGSRVEINTVESIMNSADKLRMKTCFAEHEVKTAEWVKLVDWSNQFEYPVVLKHRFGSRGTGNYLIKSRDEFNSIVSGKTQNNYIVEKYHDYNREYRLHVTADGCFYTCRKLLKNETPEGERWFRNDSNSTWIVDTNPSFDRPTNWDNIVAECVKALRAVGLDFGACDVRVQSAKNAKDKDRKEPKFFIVEINSAPSFGDITTQKYLETLPGLLMKKYTEWHKKKAESIGSV